MRFNSQAYDKVFPRQTEVEHVESSVETFKPSETEQENTGEESVVDKTTEPEVLDPSSVSEPSLSKGGDVDGNGNAGEPNNE